jgi:hypothetical protein
VRVNTLVKYVYAFSVQNSYLQLKLLYYAFFIVNVQHLFRIITQTYLWERYKSSTKGYSTLRKKICLYVCVCVCVYFGNESRPLCMLNTV